MPDWLLLVLVLEHFELLGRLEQPVAVWQLKRTQPVEPLVKPFHKFFFKTKSLGLKKCIYFSDLFC